MNRNHQFLSLLKDMDKEFSGWDFSFVSGTGRMNSGLLSWSYGSMVRTLIHQASTMLDMGTGGGEFLSLLRPFPLTVFATEGYKPNVPVAKKRLEPLGVHVVSIEDDDHLPFPDQQFDLIINQHESYSPREVRRIIKDRGIFLTQQVGGFDCIQINEALGTSINSEYENWNLQSAVAELEKNHFKIVYSKEEFPVQRFYDIGAFVYYLKAIPWQVPDFSVGKYGQKLYEIHQMIQEKGFFDVKQHRFIIKAEAI